MEHCTTLPIERRKARERTLLGIDEAGRGSLVGDMFVVGVCIPVDKIELLRQLGVRDSKTLTPQRREELYKAIENIAKTIIVERIPPSRIDSENLNKLFLEAVSNIVGKALELCKDVDTVYVDLTGSESKLLESIRRTGFKGNIIAEHHADRKYIIVSTASIIAKVLRDRHIAELSRVYGNIGSGYPSDPKTIRWLLETATKEEIPPIIRRTWSTLRRYLPRIYVEKKTIKGVKTLDEFLSK